jgi:hypothetical protein
MTLMAETDGIEINKSYYVTSNTNSNITISTSTDGNTANAVSLTSASTALLQIDTSSYYVENISNDKYIELKDASFLNVGDKIYFTGTSIGNVTVTTDTSDKSNIAPGGIYTVASVDTIVNKITVAEDTNFTGLPANTTNMSTRLTVWRLDTPIATSYATGDIVKVNYRLPTTTISDNAYVELVSNSNNKIKLHTTSTGASTSSTTDILVIPYNAKGTVGKPQSIVILKEHINYPVGTVLPMLFEQSLTTTNFGLINNKEYYIRILSSTTAAVYNYEDDADVDVERIPLVSQQGGQFVYGSNYDSIIKAGDTGAVNIVGADFTYGYGPEELVAGIITDGINFTVTTRPGATWDPLAEIPGTARAGWKINDDQVNLSPVKSLYGHTGFGIGRLTNITPTPLTTILENGTNYKTSLANEATYKGYISFRDVVMSPAFVVVYINNRDPYTGQTRLTPNIYDTALGLTEYDVDWINQTVLIKDNDPALNSVSDPGKTYDVVVYEYGNGSLLLRSNSERYPFRTVESKRNTVLSGVKVNAAGEFEFTAADLSATLTSMTVVISGALRVADTATITGYYGTTREYSILTTDGSTKVTLSGITATQGTVDGLTFTLVVKEYHSEIYLDVCYHSVELPSASNYWLSTQIVVGSSTTDTERLTNLLDVGSPVYGDLNPNDANYKGHYTIQAQRPIDPVNDP